MSDTMIEYDNPLDHSILIDTRVANNVDENDDGFDLKLIPLINTQIMMAHQFGIGPNGFRINGISQTWRDYLGDSGKDLEAIKTWLGYTVLLLFDPPDNGSVLRAIQDQVQKMEWMLCNKSCLEGYAKEYVPEHRVFYERIAEATADED